LAYVLDLIVESVCLIRAFVDPERAPSTIYIIYIMDFDRAGGAGIVLLLLDIYLVDIK
jgi:hypothetical protein